MRFVDKMYKMICCWYHDSVKNDSDNQDKNSEIPIAADALEPFVSEVIDRIRADQAERLPRRRTKFTICRSKSAHRLLKTTVMQ